MIEAAPEGKKVVFIDEMPWMDTPRSKFLSALEHFWNAWGSAREDLVMIVCGSASTWIVNNVLKNRGGLHNRVTDQIHLLPFTLSECEELSRELGCAFSRQELCELYMILGGVAYYWGFLRKGESVGQNIDRLFFAENAKLRGEFDSMIASLFRRDAGVRKVFGVLATKGVGISREELLQKTGMCDGKVFCQTLEGLEKCGFIRRYTAYGKKQRGALYQLIDSLALFHLRFIAPEANPDPQGWTTGVSSREKSVWAGIAFERVCLLHVNALKHALGISGVKTNTYAWSHMADDVYGRGAQIDLLIDRADSSVAALAPRFGKLLAMNKPQSAAVNRPKLNENGEWRCATLHHMGRRLPGWDYRRPAIYVITIVVADRLRQPLGAIEIRRGGAGLRLAPQGRNGRGAALSAAPKGSGAAAVGAAVMAGAGAPAVRLAPAVQTAGYFAALGNRFLLDRPMAQV